MEKIGQYLLSVAVAALICGILSALVGKKTTGGALVKLLCGLFLVATVISPWAQVQLDDLTSYLDSLTLDANTITSAGVEIAAEEEAAIIKSKLEAYILDKADSLGLDLAVDVTLEEIQPYLPHTVTLTGTVSPYAKQVLSQYIADDLGIPEAYQLWN